MSERFNLVPSGKWQTLVVANDVMIMTCNGPCQKITSTYYYVYFVNFQYEQTIILDIHMHCRRPDLLLSLASSLRT